MRKMRLSGGMREIQTSTDDDKVVLVELAVVDVAGDVGVVGDVWRRH